jgi:glycerol-3-phosphate dehydrogenase
MTDLLSAINRIEIISKFQNETFDLIIIGGGITGAGIALDAASRGMKVALVEKNDFASGTSSRSTKLVHGGLRYLKQFEIALVREVGQERAIVHKLAHHLVTSEKMLLPLTKDGTFGKFSTSIGLMVYDVLAGVEKADHRKMLSKEETLLLEPLLDGEKIEGSGLYAEYRTDDARLTIEIIKTAANYGAVSLNYIKAEDFLYNKNGIVSGIKCFDILLNSRFSINSKIVISATGPWVDKLRELNHSMNEKRLFLSKGVHIVIAHDRFPLNQSVYFDTSDGRMIFAIPRGKVTYIGTTDTPYKGDLNHILANQEDVDYLLEATNSAFPTLDLKNNDVISSWAGLRPLIFEEGKSASEISRKDEIFESPNGLLSIAGGKLTGYRKMAEKIVNLVSEKLESEYNLDLKKCQTDQISFTGGPFKNAEEVYEYRSQIEKMLDKFDLDKYYAAYLVANYGRQSDAILEKFQEINENDVEVRLGLSELWFGVHHELVFNSKDFFMRRTGRLYFDIKSIEKLIDPVILALKNYFCWNDEKVVSEKKELEKMIHEASNFEYSKHTGND